MNEYSLDQIKLLVKLSNWINGMFILFISEPDSKFHKQENINKINKRTFNEGNSIFFIKSTFLKGVSTKTVSIYSTEVLYNPEKYSLTGVNDIYSEIRRIIDKNGFQTLDLR